MGGGLGHYVDGGISMAELTSKQRSDLPDSDFVIIAKGGERKYPIHDVSHARNALARVAQHGTPAEKKKVRAAVRRRYPEIGDEQKKGKLKRVFAKRAG